MWFSLRLITLIILNVSTLLLLYYILISSRTCHSYLIAQYTFVKIINKNRLVKWSETIGQVCVDCWKFWGFNQSSCQRGYLSIYIQPVTSLCIIIFESLLILVTFIRGKCYFKSYKFVFFSKSYKFENSSLSPICSLPSQ